MRLCWSLIFCLSCAIIGILLKVFTLKRAHNERRINFWENRLVIGHRGVRNEAPENTLLGIYKAKPFSPKIFKKIFYPITWETTVCLAKIHFVVGQGTGCTSCRYWCSGDKRRYSSHSEPRRLITDFQCIWICIRFHYGTIKWDPCERALWSRTKVRYTVQYIHT